MLGMGAGESVSFFARVLSHTPILARFLVHPASKTAADMARFAIKPGLKMWSEWGASGEWEVRSGRAEDGGAVGDSGGLGRQGIEASPDDSDLNQRARIEGSLPVIMPLISFSSPKELCRPKLHQPGSQLPRSPVEPVVSTRVSAALFLSLPRTCLHTRKMTKG